MLSRAVRTGLSVTALASSMTMTFVSPASASGVLCLLTDPQTGRCYLEAYWTQPDGGAVVLEMASGGSERLQRCPRPRRTVADGGRGPAVVDCYGGRLLGWYSYRYDCYFLDVTDRFLGSYPDDAVYLEGTEPGGDGYLYRVRCFFEHYNVPYGWLGEEVFYYVLPSPPDGYEGTPDPTADLVVQAFNELGLRGPEIGTAPPETGAALVGMPVWLWTEITEQTWGEPEASASAGGVTVTARAQARRIDWHMGDGHDPVTCDAGRPWQPGDDPRDPPCGYTYTRPSRHLPGGRYEITGVTTWDVTWSVSGGPSDGRGGTVTLTPQSRTTLRVNEVQVLVAD